MSANELVDRARATFLFRTESDANPPTFIAGNGVKVDTLTRIGVGTYSMGLDQAVGVDKATGLIPLGQANISVMGQGIALSLSSAITVGTTPGRFDLLVVITHDAAGVLTDSGADLGVELLIFPQVD